MVLPLTLSARHCWGSASALWPRCQAPTCWSGCSRSSPWLSACTSPSVAWAVWWGRGSTFWPSMSGSWRMHWGLCGVLLAVAGVLTCLVLREDEREQAHAAHVARHSQSQGKAGIYRTGDQWTASQALRTWQFYVIAAAYTYFLLCGITVNSFAVAHITDRGFSPEMAAGLLSAQAFLNALSRVVGGAIGEIFEPKKLLAGSLVLLIAGVLALSLGTSWSSLLVFCGGIGIGYGMTFLATSVMLSNYFGRGPYLELFSVMNLISTLACFSPLLAGAIKDSTGSFTTAFLSIVIVPMLVLLATLAMRPPRLVQPDAAAVVN